MTSSRTVVIFTVLISLVFQSGCALLYELQPHRLQRMNRGPAPSLDPEFTQWTPTQPTGITQGLEVKVPTMSANSAEVAIVRAQSPQASLD